ncbi:MAG: hypothetical protein KKC66_00615, partial [Candidatus Omnitrophica bacterium]|nr:hypothetical protein [Candidatus Omnitrophota bacterium]
MAEKVYDVNDMETIESELQELATVTPKHPSINVTFTIRGPTEREKLLSFLQDNPQILINALDRSKALHDGELSQNMTIVLADRYDYLAGDHRDNNLIILNASDLESMIAQGENTTHITELITSLLSEELAHERGAKGDIATEQALAQGCADNTIISLGTGHIEGFVAFVEKYGAELRDQKGYLIYLRQAEITTPDEIEEIILTDSYLDNLIGGYFEEYDRKKIDPAARKLLIKALKVRCLSINDLKMALDRLGRINHLDEGLAADILFDSRLKEKPMTESFTSRDVERIIGMLGFLKVYDGQRYLEYGRVAIDMLDRAFSQENKDELITTGAVTTIRVRSRFIIARPSMHIDWNALEKIGLVIPDDTYERLSYTALVRLRGCRNQKASEALDSRLERVELASIELRGLIILVDYFGKHRPDLQEALEAKLSQENIEFLDIDILILLCTKDNMPFRYWNIANDTLVSRLTSFEMGSPERKEGIRLLIETLEETYSPEIKRQLIRILLKVLEVPFDWEARERIYEDEAILLAKLLTKGPSAVSMLFREEKHKLYTRILRFYLEEFWRVRMDNKGRRQFIRLFIEKASKEEVRFIVGEFLEKANWDSVKDETYIPHMVREAVKERLPDLNLRAPYEDMIERNEMVIQAFITSDADYKAVDMGTGHGEFLS